MSCSLFYVLANPDASLVVLDTLPNAAIRQSILTPFLYFNVQPL
jgi:hypothetical protein